MCRKNYNNTEDINRLRAKVPVLWINPDLGPVETVLPALGYGIKDIHDASDRLDRFAPLLADLFDDTRVAGGIIESDLIPVPAFQKLQGDVSGINIPGKLMVKADHALPVAGSITSQSSRTIR